MWRANMADFLRHEQRDLTLLALVCVLDVEGKSRLEGLQHDMRALELDIKMHLIRSRSTGDPCKCRTGALDQGDSEQLLNRDLRDLAFLCHEARDFIIPLAVKSKNYTQKFRHFCINCCTENCWWRKEKLVVWSDK